MGVPYVIVKNKARLGTVVHKKTAAVVTLQDVRSEDNQALSTLVQAAKANFGDKYEDARRHWGGGIRGNKSYVGDDVTSRSRSPSSSRNFLLSTASPSSGRGPRPPVSTRTPSPPPSKRVLWLELSSRVLFFLFFLDFIFQKRDDENRHTPHARMWRVSDPSSSLAYM